MAKVWGKMCPFLLPPWRGATFAALVRADTWGLHDGPSASWVTWVGPLNWVSPTVKYVSAI